MCAHDSGMHTLRCLFRPWQLSLMPTTSGVTRNTATRALMMAPANETGSQPLEEAG